MKFVCMKCESFMTFQKVESPSEQALGVSFACASCGARIAMVTNAGETALVQALGVQIGGRKADPGPMEFTRENLKDPGGAVPMPSSAYAEMAKAASHGGNGGSGGSCPFAGMVAKMQAGMPGTGETASDTASNATELIWTKEAQERIERVPSFMRPMISMGIENYAKRNGIATITPDVMDASKNDPGDIAWPKEAEARLDNIPSFVRPMARKEIERIAKERGMTTITAELLEETKTKFIGLGY